MFIIYTNKLFIKSQYTKCVVNIINVFFLSPNQYRKQALRFKYMMHLKNTTLSKRFDLNECIARFPL